MPDWAEYSAQLVQWHYVDSSKLRSEKWRAWFYKLISLVNFDERNGLQKSFHNPILDCETIKTRGVNATLQFDCSKLSSQSPQIHDQLSSIALCGERTPRPCRYDASESL